MEIIVLIPIALMLAMGIMCSSFVMITFVSEQEKTEFNWNLILNITSFKLFSKYFRIKKDINQVPTAGYFLIACMLSFFALWLTGVLIE